ncbi:MAG: DUF3794 domain-containing protein [Ruminococcaceae bacterium]|nr:DUF3794 domain-containing protein [Oscillospiraceae bacterium]
MDNYLNFRSDIENNSALMQIYEGVKHTEISEEFILPDYLPDVKRIIKVSAKPRIDTKYVTMGRVEYEGDVVAVILFIDEENKLRTVTFKAAFADAIEVSDIMNECVANLMPYIDNANCRLLNPRRVALRVRVDTESSIWCNRNLKPLYTGDLSNVKAEELKKDMQSIRLITAGENGLNVSADIEVDGALPQIGEVISCKVDMSFFECKASEGKILCRGEMPITVFYSSPSDNGENYTVLFRKLPVAQVIGADGADESFECMARGAVDDVKVKVSENGFSEKRILELEITYRIYLNCVKKDNVTVTCDVYAPKRNADEEMETVKFCYPARNYSVNFSASKSVSRSEMELENAEGVFELSAEAKVTSVEKNSAGKLSVKGVADVDAIFKGSEGLFSVKYDIPFETELDSTGVPDKFEYNADIVCMCAKGRLDAENFYTELEMQLGLMILGCAEIEILKEAEFTVAEEEKTPPQMRFYYPDASETMWDICKRFGVSYADIENNNTIKDGKIPEVILIPLMK